MLGWPASDGWAAQGTLEMPRDEIRIVLGRRLNDLLPGDETGDAHGIIAQQFALEKRTAHLTIRWSQKKWEEFMGMPYSTALTSEARTSCRRSDGGNPSSAAWRLSVASIVVAAARYGNRARHNPRGDLVKGMRRSLALSFRCWSLVTSTPETSDSSHQCRPRPLHVGPPNNALPERFQPR
jgi:hypothetical protein